MMRIVLGFIAGLSALGAAQSAMADITYYPAGDILPTSWVGSVATFDSITPTAYGQTTATGAFTDGGMSFSGSGVVMNNGGQGSDGLYATPYGDTSNYMAVLGGGSETITLSAMSQKFGLYWGSIDTYNSIQFYNGATLVASFTGADISVPPAYYGNQSNYASNAAVLFSNIGLFNSVVLSSSANSFEFDNVYSAVPEASTWAMMLTGFASLGFAASRRRRASVAA